MSNTTYLILTMLAMAIATFITRSLPFFALKNQKDHPVLNFIGMYLPPSVMLLLVIYCLKDVKFLISPFGIPEIFSVTLVALLHFWKRNSLLSIGMGTAFYMALIRTDWL